MQFSSYVEFKEDDVPVFHDVFLSLLADKTLFLCLYHISVQSFKFIKGDDLRLDKAALKIGVYFSGSLGGLCSLGNRPRSYLVGPAVKKLIRPKSSYDFLISRARPLSFIPNSSMKSCFSSSSRPESSSSTRADMVNISAPVEAV